MFLKVSKSIAAMIIGIGVDIEAIDKFKESCKNKNFLNLIFTKREIEYCKKMKKPYFSYAGKFCAKEAVIKALGERLSMKDIEVINSKEGKPRISLKGKKSIKIHCSISHTDVYAVANVLAEKIDK